MIRRLTILCLFTLLSLTTAPPPAGAAEAAFVPEPGVHYELLTPPVPRSGDKPEVVEVFNFKCGHCFDLFPVMVEWAEKNGDRYAYKVLPIYWGEQTDMPLRAYYAAEFLGKAGEMKAAIFNAQFKNGSDIESPGELGFIAEEIGLDNKSFQSYLTSFGVSAKVTQARALQRAFGVHSTPTLVINGRFKVSSGKHAKGDHALLFRIIDALATR